MDELAPSLVSSAGGGASAASVAGLKPSSPGGGRNSGGDVDGAGGEKVEAGEDGAAVGETVIGRCTAAALATGVDCVLDEEFSASREPARVAGFSQVRGA